MNNNKRKCEYEWGMALLTAVIFIAMGTLILTALATRVVTQSHQVSQYVEFTECLQGVEAGFAQSRVEIDNGQDGNVGLGTWAPPMGSTTLVLPQFSDAGIAPLTLTTMPRVQYMAYTLNWVNDGLDNNGNGSVDEPAEAGIYSIYSLAQSGAVDRTAEMVIAGGDVNVWRNAIFGGTGQAGGLINGNVSIYGSVHLLGDNIPEGGIAVCALDLSGTSLIHNNYVGLTAELAARVPALPTRLFNGEMVQTLNANLRVKNGLVGLSGNSEIGEPNVAGNAVKETMDGCYVEDGWTGNKVTPDGGRGDPQSVYSDNGWDELYDLGDRVQLPLLDDDYRDMYTGAKIINPVTGRYYTHREYFDSVLCGIPHNGDITIAANQHFYYNATTGQKLVGSLPATPPAAGDKYILFNKDTNVMQINGQIKINGNLTITRGGGGDKTIHYTGRAALFVTGYVTLNTDLLSRNSNGTTANSFPVNNCFGIMAQNNMYVGTLSQLELMGAFYAQNMIRTEKQSTIMGTFVSNYFDMGTNVPRIFQVPTLADNLPLGMVGAYPILMFSQRSWRELGV